MALLDPGTEDREIGRTVKLLGGQRALRRPVRTRLDAHDLLQRGLPGRVLKHLVDDVAMLRVAGHGSLEKAVGMSLRTYQRHREAPDKLLSPEQSGRTWKFAEILGRAIELFGAQEDAGERPIARHQHADIRPRRRVAPGVADGDRATTVR